jgi:hypothetical protein
VKKDLRRMARGAHLRLAALRSAGFPLGRLSCAGEAGSRGRRPGWRPAPARGSVSSRTPLSSSPFAHPHENKTCLAANRQEGSVPCQGANRRPHRKRAGRLTGSRVPQPHRVASSSRGDGGPVERERHGPHPALVAPRGPHRLTRSGVPQPHSAVITPRGHSGPVGRERHRLRSVLVELAPTRQSDWERFVDPRGSPRHT